MNQSVAQNYISSARKIRQSMRSGNILIIDDDQSISNLLLSLSEALGHKAEVIDNFEDAHLHIMSYSDRIRLAVIDYSLNGIFADPLIESCCASGIPCIIHTGHKEKLAGLKARYPDIVVILKPSSIELLIKELA